MAQFCERHWGLAVLTTIATVITYKRIAILSLALCFVVWVLPERVQRVILHPFSMVVMNGLYILLTIYFTVGEFDAFISSALNTSADAVTMGRQSIYSGVVEHILTEPFKVILLGNGAGSVYEAIDIFYQSGRPANLHNDILKIFYEYGGIVSAIFVLLLYRSNNLGQRLFALYTNMLFMTDNVLIYHYYLFFYVVLSRIVTNKLPIWQSRLLIKRLGKGTSLRS